MKLVKLSVFALSMGLALASCGDKGAEGAKTGTDSMAATTAPAAPTATEPAKTDTMTAGPAKDTTKPADAGKMDAGKMDAGKKMEGGKKEEKKK